MKILLCLLSGQHVPNLLSIHYFKPDHLVMVETPEMNQNKAGSNLLSALALGNLDYSTRNECLMIEREDDLEEIRTKLSLLYQKHKSAEWIVNLTGGTKPMSIAAFDFFRDLGQQLIYTNVKRPSEIIELTTGRLYHSSKQLDLVEFMAGYGIAPVKDMKNLDAAKKRAIKWWDCSHQIALHAQPDEQCLVFALDEDENTIARKEARSKGSLLCEKKLCPAQAADVIAQTFNLSGNSGTWSGHLDKYAIDFLTGGWLEIFIYGCLHLHREALKIHDLTLGMHFQDNIQNQYVDKNPTPNPSNDLDVSFIRNHKLFMIECKSGMNHDKGGDILYKIESIIGRFKAVRVQTFLVAASVLKPAIHNRAKVHNCRILDSESILNLAKNVRDVEQVSQIFFGKASH